MQFTNLIYYFHVLIRSFRPPLSPGFPSTFAAYSCACADIQTHTTTGYWPLAEDQSSGFCEEIVVSFCRHHERCQRVSEAAAEQPLHAGDGG